MTPNNARGVPEMFTCLEMLKNFVESITEEMVAKAWHNDPVALEGFLDHLMQFEILGMLR